MILHMLVCGRLVGSDCVVFCYALPQYCVLVRQIPVLGILTAETCGKTYTFNHIYHHLTPLAAAMPGPGSRQGWYQSGTCFRHLKETRKS